MAGAQLLHQVFEDQAHNSPSSWALEFHENEKLTYQQLNESANRFARYLCENQLPGRDVVALCPDKSPFLIIAILGVLKAGMVWIPLPADATEDRIHYILESSNAGVVFGLDSTKIPAKLDLTFIALQHVFEGDKLAAYSHENINNPSKTENDLCHILFTSGSTGTPKGVMIEHRAVRHNAVELSKMFGLDSQTRTLQFAAPTFDVFGLDVFMTFACGGCLVMAPRETMMEDLTAFMRKTRITYTQLTPTVIQTIDPEGIPDLRVLASSGEALPQELAARWRNRLRLFNAYGPTETIVCTVEDLSKAGDVEASCIGRPVPGLEVRLLGDDGQEVAPGELGEVSVAGPQLLRCYLSKEGRVQPPEACVDGVRFYKTGDLGSWETSSAGIRTIKLMGRRDAEVKLRGIRIDLADVERSVSTSPYVSKCIVVMPRRGCSSGRLSCFLVLNALPQTPEGTCKSLQPSIPLLKPSPIIRAMLQEAKLAASTQLPALAVPKTWWPVNELPLSTSGKTNRLKLQSWLEDLGKEALRELIEGFGAEGPDQVAVTESEEQALQSLWADVLLRPVSSIGITASIADLGADSLDVIKMAAKARAVGINVNAADIFSARTIQELIHRYSSKRKPPPEASLSRTYRPFSSLDQARPLGPLLEDAAKTCNISVSVVEDIYPCTPYATALMTLDIKCPGSYICAFSWTLRNDIDTQRLNDAWNTLINSQATLRNRLIWDSSTQKLLQVQVQHCKVKWDKSHYDAPMSLGSDLCRALAQWEEDAQRWIFHLKIHHSIVDGWSLQLMLNQLKKLYYGENVNLLEAAAYSKFVHQLIDAQENIQDASKKFWTGYLKGCSEGEFPPATPDAHHEVHATTHQSVAVNIDIQELASKFGVTPAVILYGITALVLATHGDTDDVVLGLILAGRDAPLDGVFQMIGPAFACVPFRTRVSHKTALPQYFQGTQKRILDITPHQHYGLERIKKCGPGAAVACRLQTLLVVQPEDEALAGAGLWEAVHGQSSGIADSVPFSVEMILSDHVITINCNSDPAIISPQHAQMVTDHLGQALQNLADLSIHQTVGQIQLATEEQNSRMLKWTESYGPALDVCLHSLLERSAERFPDHFAIFENATGKKFTYKELDILSSQLAFFLSESSLVSKGKVIPLAMEKCTLAIVGIFAVMKMGCAYVPIDPSWPIERVRRIVDAAGARSIACSANTAAEYGSLEQELILLDDSHLTIRSPDVRNNYVSTGKPSDLAVLMYTSGSTGMPKGVMLEHRALSTSVTHLSRVFDLQPGYHHLQFSAFIYDVSISDIFIPLLSGACICIPTEEDRLNRLSETIRKMEINSAILTPSMTSLISLEDASSLKTIMTGGEMTSRALMKTWAPRIRFLNAYGPTEASITTTVTEPLKVDSDPGIIGLNVTAWHMILRRDEEDELYEAPFGCTGEIAIAGHSVARGYLNNEELTNKCFVTYPGMEKFKLPSRVYLTGDIGRYELDGSVRILGRRDRMMKINGVRVDPGEAEGQLRKLGSPYNTAVVQPIIDENGIARLAAFIPVNNHESVTGALILSDACTSSFLEESSSARNKLLESLPGPYVPSMFVPISRVPSTGSDKTDYKKLRDEIHKFDLSSFIVTAGAAEEDSTEYSNPRTPMEQLMEAAFRQIFPQQERIGASADFFRLGGDSFAAIKLVSAAKEQNLEITVQQLYQCPRLRDLASIALYKRDDAIGNHVNNSKQSPSQLSQVSREVWQQAMEEIGLSQNEIEDIYPATPFQEGLMAVSLQSGIQPDGQSDGIYKAKMVFKIPPNTDFARLSHAINQVASKHPILRTQFISSSVGLMQVVRRAISGDKSQHDQRNALFRYEIEASSSELPAKLVVCIHHALYDAPTIHMLLQEVNLYYHKPNSTAPATIHYKRFVEHVVSNSMERASEFWSEYLHDAPLTPFPPTSEVERQAMATQHVDLSTNLSLELLRKEGITAATVLTGALALLLSTYTFDDQVCFGITLSGRDDAEFEKVVGPTLCTMPARVHLSPEESVISFLRQIQNSVLSMRQHQNLGLKGISQLPGQGPRNATRFRSLLVIQQKSDSDSSESQVSPVVGELLSDESSMHIEYPLAIIGGICPSTGQMELRIEFDPAYISQTQAERFIHQIEHTVAQLSLLQSQTSDLNLISTHDTAEIMSWNPLPPKAPASGILSMFHGMAHRQPNSPAIESIVAGDRQTTTYKELDESSTALARAIRQYAPNNQTIALCHPNSLFVLTAMLAVWKAGKAFATMDPSVPSERRQKILVELGDNAAVLTSTSLTPDFSSFSCHNLDEMMQDLAVIGGEHENIEYSCNLSDTAYVFFTSGSSGTPKGVVVKHSSIALSMSDVGATMGLNTKSRMLQFATSTFDTSLLEIFATLIAGGCVCLPSRSERLDGSLANAINQLQISHLVLTPTVASLLSPGDLPSVECLMLVGEPPSKQLLKQWASASIERPLQVMNGYGPTEASVHSSTNISLRSDDPQNIGTATACRLILVSPNDPKKLTPIGAVGELVICGDTVADGYLGRPEQTSQVFGIGCPWDIWPQNSLPIHYYRTGDLARYASDGSLVYLGRKDSQVKIHGQRIELAEIEWNIRQSSQYLDCVVEVVTPRTLVAFILIHDSGLTSQNGPLSSGRIDGSTVSRIRSRLRSVLPEYMVPSVYVPYRRWPTTTSGKVDRRQLRDSVQSSLQEYRIQKTGPKRPAQSRCQMILFESVSEVMSIGVDQIGLDDSIVSLGGDSITMIRIMAIARKRQLNIDMSHFNQTSTIEEMAAKSESQIPARIEAMTAPPLPYSLIQDLDQDYIRTQVAGQCQVSIDSIIDVYPCTAMQEALMISSTKTTGAFLNREVFKLRPNLSIAKLTQAIKVLWKRHDILRTRIVLEQSRSLQVVLAEDVDISQVSTDNVQEFLSRDSITDFGYGKRLSRFAIISAPSKSYLVVSQHHAVFDGWSMGLLRDEIDILYSESNAELPPAEPFSPFCAYSADVCRMKEANKYWDTKLAGLQTAALPQLQPNSTFATNQKHSLTVQLSNNTSYTLATLAEASWGLMLGLYLDSEDVSFGVVRSGRTAPITSIDKLMGPTLTSIPRRLQPARQQKVQSYLEQVQNEISGAVPWEQYGVSNIRKIHSDAAQACQFNSMLVIQPPVTPDEDQGSKVIMSSEDHLGTSSIDSDCLMVDCQAIGDGHVKISIIYDDRAMSQDDVQWIAYHFSQALNEISSKGEGFIQDLNISGPERLIQEQKWNDTPIESCNQRVDQIFSERAREWPGFVAVEAPDASLTYEELDNLSSAGAYKLRFQHGVQRGDLVPMLMNKGAAMVIAMLSILKVGAAYVPLPIDAPVERLQLLTQQMDSKLFVVASSQVHLAKALPLQSTVLDIEELSSFSVSGPIESSKASNCDYESRLGAGSDLAYVLFTSGSTGTPKGVMIQHSALATTALTNGRLMEYQPKTRTLSFASYTFDVNVIEIYLTLLHGGCLYIPPDNRRLVDLSAYINENQIQLAFLTPTAIQNLLQSPEKVPSLKTLRSGGEPLPKSIMQDWCQSVRLINSYGPTETCVDACRNPEVTFGSDPKNIGFSIATHLWVVERGNYGSLAPVGCPGELLISGPTLAKGYFKDEERTLAAFIDGSKYPWVLCGEERLYVTGDVVQRNSDGSITFIGRKDLQVKVNGFRIELGEVEQNVESCPRVTSAVVEKIKSETDGSDNLVAFFTLDSKDSNGSGLLLHSSDRIRSIIQDIQARLDGLLPPYMVPRVYIPLAHIPLTSSGKTDRRALQKMMSELSPDKMLSYQAAQSVIRQPLTAIQRILQGLWAHVLKVDPSHLGLDTKFTRAGGDSLAAISLASLCREIGFKLDVADILRIPQLEQMANHVEKCQQDNKQIDRDSGIQTPTSSEMWYDPDLYKQASEACNLNADNIEDIYPCTPTQESLIAAAVRQPRAYIDHSMFLIPSSLNISQLQAAWQIVHEANAILRTRICPMAVDKGMQMMQVVARGSNPWVDVDDYDSALEFGLGTQLVRYRIRSSEKGHVFEIWRHHAIFDGFSSAALWQDLQHVFENATPPNPRPSFRAYVEFVRSVDESGAISFWKSQLDSHQPEAFPALPSPEYVPQANSNNSRILESEFSWNPSTPFSFATIARAAWAVALSMRSRSHGVDKDICFAATMSGRTAPLAGIEDIIGPTITTIPVRMKFSLDDSLSTLLENIQDQSLEMIPFEHFGLGRIRDINASTREASACSTLLVVQPAQIGDSALPLGLQRLDESPEGFSEPFGLVTECSQSSTKDRIVVSAAYDTSLLTVSEATHILEQFQQMIFILHNHCSQNSTVKSLLWELAEGTDLQRTIAWNPLGDSSLPPQLHQLAEETAKKHPQQLAIDCDDGQMTYAELVAAMNSLAHWLQDEFDVKPGCLVPLCTEKSRFMIVGILGIMKAGAGYVPLDTNHPEARLKLILNEIKANVVVVSPLQASRRQFPTNTLVLDWGRLPIIDPPAVQQLSTPDDIAYVIFTSGSSGTPKGVVMEHKAASRSILEHAKRYLHDREGVKRKSLQFSSYTFDASVVDIFAVLACGGCVCIPSETQGVNELEGYIQAKGINFADLTPTVVNLIDPAQTASLSTLAIGGEMANRAVLNKWAGPRSPVENFFNAYGPTEAGIACAVGRLTATSQIGSVGQALGAGLWIVDDLDHNQLQPIGCIGELVATGTTLARGYLNDPKKTSKAFLEDVAWLSKVGQTRLYKTGDLARFDVHGNVEIVGRREDTQIKFRGLRIELGEIETAIAVSTCSSRIQRVAVTKIDRDGIPMLAAFVQFSSHDKCSATPVLDSIFCRPSESFGAFVNNMQPILRQQLPEYMVPQLWLPISDWPLLASSKTNRKLLAASAESLDPKSVSEYQRAPVISKNIKASAQLDEIEEAIQESWLQVLRKDAKHNFQPHDDFFQQGGDSLTTIMLVTALRKRGIRITALEVFSEKTLSGIASRCRQTKTEAHKTRIHEEASQPSPLAEVSVKTNGHPEINEARLCTELRASAPRIERVYPATFTQMSFLIEAQKWTRSYYAWAFFELDNNTAASRVQSACSTLASRHPILRTSFHMTHGKCFQAVQTSAIDFKVLISSNLPDRMCATIDADTGNPVEFGRVLTRFRLMIDPESGMRTLSLGLSHAQYDGFSLSTIWNDLRSAYLGILDESKSSPDYHSFIQHTVEISNQQTDAFWRDRLQGSSLTIISDTVSAESPTMSHSITRTIPFQFQSSALKNYGAISKAAWALALSAVSQSTDVAFWNLVSGRFAPLEGAQDVVGPCINFVPVRVHYDSKGSIFDLIRKVQEQQIESVPFEATPTDRIVQLAQWPASSTSIGTIFQYQNIPDPKEHPGKTDASWTMRGSAVYGGGLLKSGACWLLAWPNKDGQSSFRFTYSSQTLSSAAAELIMTLYIDILHAINDDPERIIASVIPEKALLPSQMPEKKETPSPPEILKSAQPILEQLEATWKDSLGITDPIEQDASFFEIGGDSLKAIELAEECTKSGFGLKLQDVFEFPTLRLQTLWIFDQVSRPAREVPRLKFRAANELN